MKKPKFSIGDIITLKSESRAVGYIKGFGPRSTTFSTYHDYIDWFKVPVYSYNVNWDDYFSEDLLWKVNEKTKKRRL
jgi:hypothetical protein